MNDNEYSDNIDQPDINKKEVSTTVEGVSKIIELLAENRKSNQEASLIMEEITCVETDDVPLKVTETKTIRKKSSGKSDLTDISHPED